MNSLEHRMPLTDGVVTCVYCGMEYPEGTPTHGASVLTEHIKVCKKHPMRELESQLSAAFSDLTHERMQKEAIFAQLQNEARINVELRREIMELRRGEGKAE